MPQEPKKRHSRQRQGKRRAAIKLTAPKTVICPNCQNPTLSHAVCTTCGYYKGREIVIFKSKDKKQSETGQNPERVDNEKPPGPAA